MPTPNDRDAVSAALKHTFAALPPKLKNSVAAHWESGSFEKPDLLRKEDPGKHIYRVRLLPTGRPRSPRNFWTSTWCFYEIGAGRFPNHYCSWESQFFMACRNKACGKGRHIQEVRRIVEAANGKRANARGRFDPDKEFAFLTVHGNELDPKAMGDAMAWVISNTLHAFQQIDSATRARVGSDD